MNDPNSPKRERVRELRLMAVQARYHALRMSNDGAAPNLQAYADELEDEAARLENLLHPGYSDGAREREKPRSNLRTRGRSGGLPAPARH
jgi:hypothetical protein